jgi:GT2 family glycosyltransferase
MKTACVALITYCHNDDVIQKTQHCFASVLSATNMYAPNWYQIMIVDNGSNDKFKAWLKTLEESHLRVKVIYNKENLMFAKAANQAMEASLGYDYCVILNNDTIPRLGWLFSMMQAAESDPKIAVVGAKILQPGTDLVIHTGTILKDGHVVDPYGQGTPKKLIPRKIIEDRLWVNGCCMLIKTSVIKEFGYFDDVNYSLYFEEADYMIRLRQAGYRVVYCPMAEIEHHQKATAVTIPTAKDNFYANWEKLSRHYYEYWKSLDHIDGCPKVAIVVPAYNAEKTIRPTLNSLFSQTYVNYELFAIDNMSTDSTLDILKEYKKIDDESKGLITGKNDRFNIGSCSDKGVAFARNEAIRQIVKKGGFKYVFFLDADDLWNKDYLEKQVFQLERYGFDMVYALCDKKFEDGTTAVPFGIPEPTIFDRELLYKQNYIFNSFVGVKLEILVKAGEFRNDLNGVEDYEMWHRIAKNGANIYCNSEVLGTYMVRRDGNSNAANGTKEKLEEITGVKNV